MHGETVTVHDRVKTGTDRFNNPIYEETAVEVANVLVAPGAAVDVNESARPSGVLVAYTLYFPKAYLGELANKRIDVRGNACKVVGHPDRYLAENTPGPWNLVVEVEAVDG